MPIYTNAVDYKAAKHHTDEYSVDGENCFYGSKLKGPTQYAIIKQAKRAIAEADHWIAEGNPEEAESSIKQVIRQSQKL